MKSVWKLVFMALAVHLSSAKDFIIESTKVIEGARTIVEYEGRFLSVISDNSYAELYSMKTDNKDSGIIEFYEDTIIELPELDDVDMEIIQSPLSELSWNLDTVDGKKDRAYNYTYSGEGLVLYVIDTGIYPQPEFEDRILPGKSFLMFEPSTLDCHGHGTHVSSTALGKKYGIAKNAKVMPLRVFGCIGGASTSSVLQAIYYAIQNGPKGVINMSLGGPSNSLFNKAVADAVDKGFVVVVAAGNDGGNAGNKSPASEPKAITVGSYTESNVVSYFSNEGSSVDIFAPGSSILAAYLGGQTKVWSGTSMATPLVAGVCLQILEKFPDFKPNDVANYLIDIGAEGTLTGFKMASSPNLVARIPTGIINTPAPTKGPSLRPNCYKFGRKACNRRPKCRWNGKKCILK